MLLFLFGLLFPLLLLLPSNNNNNASFFSFEAFVWHATWPSVGQVVFRYFSTTKSFFPARPLCRTKALTLRHSSAFSKRISHHRFYHHTTNTQKAWKGENGSLALLIKYESSSDCGVTNLWFGLWRPLESKSLGTNSQTKCHRDNVNLTPFFGNYCHPLFWLTDFRKLRSGVDPGSLPNPKGIPICVLMVTDTSLVFFKGCRFNN